MTHERPEDDETGGNNETKERERKIAEEMRKSQYTNLSPLFPIIIAILLFKMDFPIAADKSVFNKIRRVAAVGSTVTLKVSGTRGR